MKYVAIKGMEIPKSCAECKFCIRQKTNDYGSYGQCVAVNCETVNTLILSPGCPLTEIITCKDCVKGHKYQNVNECYCDYLRDDVDTDYYCANAKRRE